ncbi:hypothetical protein NOCA2140027 [metagenome]|uniref:HTH cro/C1-type domain-containing protein n=1 Tax=metagenome TaxID=256318 RepID=A0A2P2BWT1_9ZZZZ
MTRPSAILPHNLSCARVRCGLSREQTAVAVGRSWATVRGYELGTTTPPLDVLSALADLYGVSVGSLVGEQVSA